jgi:hypothetical protein
MNTIAVIRCVVIDFSQALVPGVTCCVTPTVRSARTVFIVSDLAGAIPLNENMWTLV